MGRGMATDRWHLHRVNQVGALTHTSPTDQECDRFPHRLTTEHGKHTLSWSNTFYLKSNHAHNFPQKHLVLNFVNGATNMWSYVIMASLRRNLDNPDPR